MCEPIDLLGERPITTVNEPLYYSERTMRTIANTVLPFVNTIEPRSAFVRRFMQELEPWTNLSPTKGKMTTRIVNYLFKEYDKASVPSLYHSAIGSYLASEAPTGAFHYDITSRLNWKKGDFGDAGSCFMGTRTNVLRTMEDEGGYALRFWKKHSNGTYSGVARAWLMPHPKGDDTPILFNAYGCSLEQYASRLRVILNDNTPMRLVYLVNQGTNTGDFYINQNMGLVLGSEGDDWKETLDFNLSTTSSNSRCDDCGRRRGQVMPVYDEHGSVLGQYCEMCIDELGAEHCPFTGNYYDPEAMTSITTIGRAHYHEGVNYQVADVEEVRCSTDFVARMNNNRSRHTCVRCGNYRPFNGRVQVYDAARGFEDVCYYCARNYSMSCRHCGTYLLPDTTCGCDNTQRRGASTYER